jgi:sugar O-acyltransferase (sialic acid O-acetyltransferase NeuD family)
MSDSVLILGAGGHAISCIDVIERQAAYAIVGLVDSHAQAITDVLGYPVLGSDDELPLLIHRASHAFVGVGQIRSAATRQRLYELLLRLGMPLATVVAPSAEVSRHSRLGAGTIVGHGAIVHALASVGENSIINSRALVEHDARIGCHCHIATGAIVNGGAEVGDGSFVGSGAVLREGVKLGKGCFIGAGSLVRGDCPDGHVLK